MNGLSTLAEARAWLEQRLEVGVKCPCCEQFAKVYRRPINRGMAQALVRLYRAGGTDWVDKRAVLRGVGSAARDEALLRYWRLLLEDEDRPGWWRVTSKGEEWIVGHIVVPKYAFVYDSRFLGHEGPDVSLTDALGERFNLQALMSS